MTDEVHLAKVEHMVKPMYAQLNLWAHAWPHIRRVAKHSRDLALLVGVKVDPIACQIAAYWHDLGRVVEEAITGPRRELGQADHSLDSISPTVDILREVGIEGYSFNSIVGAVTVHSDKLYYGRNLVAKVLRDSDKKDSLGPWGLLRNVNHHFGDVVETPRILQSQGNPEEIRTLADETLQIIKSGDPQRLNRYLTVLGFVLEWVDKRMLDTEQAYDFIRPEYEYHRNAREFLLK